MITAAGVRGKKFAVLGLGKSGLASAASLSSGGATVVAWDDNETARTAAEKAGIQMENLTELDLNGFEALILSPGIPHTHPSPHPIVAAARSAKIGVIGDIELLFRACPKATYIGITGTNGKSTTTALIGHILKTDGRKVEVGGNLGTPALSLMPLGDDGIYVLELSSYQLELIEQNRIDVAVILNITPDHIDRHGDLEGYSAAKARIIGSDRPQVLVIGTDDAPTKDLAIRSREKANIRIEEISVTHPVAHGVMVAGQQMFAYTGEEEGGLVTNLAALKTLPGIHNWQNACAAFAACRALDVPKKEIVAALKSFPGLAHRQQLIAEKSGVRFINDSKATNADATAKALACYDNIYWILGGRPKEGGLAGLEGFASRVRHAFLIGEATDTFAAWCEGRVPYTRSGTLDAATRTAAKQAWAAAKPGSVVLLSPACASLDQFKNFEERGQMFIDLVQKLEPDS